MAFFRAGDVVQITKEDGLKNSPHPNWKRPLTAGDKVLIAKVKRSDPDSYRKTVHIAYLTQAGDEVWVDGNNCRIAYKGNKEDFLIFADRHGIVPVKGRTLLSYEVRNKIQGLGGLDIRWGDMTRSTHVNERGFLPHHLHRHLKYDHDEQRHQTDKNLYIYYNSGEEAIRAAQMAWLRMTVAQQKFFMMVNSLQEIFP